MSIFDELFDALKISITDLAKGELEDFKDEALSDSKEFIKNAKTDLKKWVEQLKNGDLTKEDFAFLIKGKKDLAEMTALKQAGLSLVRIENFRNALIDTVIDTTINVIL